MSWKVKDVLTMKEEIIAKYLNQESITDLAKNYSVSRPTIYKWVKRYQENGTDGLVELSRRPHTTTNRISDKDTNLILEISDKHSWGGRKLRQRLVNMGHHSDDLPCESTFNRVLKRKGKIDPIQSEKHKCFIRFEKEKPNELWQMDFKGHFKMGTNRCHPLTVLDDHSRFSIVLKASTSESHDIVRNSLENAFREYGMPEAMTMDNGSPWKGSPPWTLSKLTVWLMQLGIKVSHSSVRHPQTQGKNERFHRSLKEELLRFHQFRNLKQTQKLFDEWQRIYNFERPHEGIKLLCPYQLYIPSPRQYLEKLPEIEYGPHDIVRKVLSNGTIHYANLRYFVGEHLTGQNVAIRPTEKEGNFLIYFVKTLIGVLDVTQKDKKRYKCL